MRCGSFSDWRSPIRCTRKACFWREPCFRAQSLAAWLNTGVWTALINRIRPRQPAAETVQVGARELPLLMVRHPRARRYLLRLLPNGTARVTIPRGGNQSEARQFVERNRSWLETQLRRLDERPARRREWKVGADILVRGALIRIESLEDGCVRLGGRMLCVGDAPAPTCGR